MLACVIKSCYKGKYILENFILRKKVKPHYFTPGRRGCILFLYIIWISESVIPINLKNVFVMTSNWHRRLWRIFYLPFHWSQSTWVISLSEVENFDLSGSALGIWQLGIFFLSHLFVIDTTIPSPFLVPALHFSAGQTVVGFAGLKAWNACSNSLWSFGFR